MKYLIVTSDNIYYMWQLLVQYNNFKKYNYHEDLIWVISYKKKPSKELINLIKKTNVETYLILDDRKRSIYSSSIRPYVLKELFKQKPFLKNHIFFHTDPDVLFTKKFDKTKILNNDIWYLSDTKSYLNSNYIKSKGEALFFEMCEIVGIEPNLVKKNDNNAGGAQLIMKNLSEEYWDKVYHDSEELYMHLSKTEKKYNPKHPIQTWTSDMWAILWNAWLMNNKTKIIKSMDFGWATDSYEKIMSHSIYHNAGVFNQKDLFNKSKFTNKHPFNEDFDYVNQKKGSFYYVKEIINTSKNFKNIIKYM